MAKEIHIAGFGPAAMYAALRFKELGFKPVFSPIAACTNSDGKLYAQSFAPIKFVIYLF